MIRSHDDEPACATETASVKYTLSWWQREPQWGVTVCVRAGGLTCTTYHVELWEGDLETSQDRSSAGRAGRGAAAVEDREQGAQRKLVFLGLRALLRLLLIASGCEE